MKITNQISYFVLFLLAILTLNTAIGLVELASVGRELKSVTETDVALMHGVSNIRRFQLEKMILFERFSRIAEELSYDEVSVARRQHLLDHVAMIQSGFDDLAQQGGRQILEAQELLSRWETPQDLSVMAISNQVRNFVDQIEQAHIQYDKVMESIFVPLLKDNTELTISELHRIQAQERLLSKKLDRLVFLIEKLIHGSFYRAVYKEKKAEWILWLSVFVTVLLSLLVVLILVKNITRPLEALGKAARDIGEGHLFVRLAEHQRDEFGDLSRAFNIMSQRLGTAKQELERKNLELSDSLLLTEKQKNDLEKVNTELDNFAHTVSHDLRSPLMGIMGYASILDSKYKDAMDERGQKCVQRIRHGVDRINQMIDDLLALTRLSRIQNPYESVDIQLVLQEVLERLEYKIKEYDVHVQILQVLPTIICDRIKITEAFLNLMSNAVKFSSKRPDGKPRIEIGYEKVYEGHQFYVKDNGIGISPDDQPKVFEIFQRVGKIEEFEGSGAGLSIVKRVVDDHGGRIWIESDLGAGAAFYFIIPSQVLVQ